MAAAHPFGAFVGCRFKRIGCVRQIKVNFTCCSSVSKKCIITTINSQYTSMKIRSNPTATQLPLTTILLIQIQHYYEIIV